MRLFLIISQILYILSFIPWFVIWTMSFMSFDSGVSLSNVVFVLVITLYPISVITCSILSWLFRVKRKRLSLIIDLIPMLWVISFLGFMFLYK
jgi:hypothetical protein